MKRRSFIKRTTAATAGAIIVPTIIPSHVLGKTAPSNRIRVGQIGFGRIAQTHDLPETLKHDMAMGVAVADVDLNRAEDGKRWIENYYTEQKGKPGYVDVAVYRGVARNVTIIDSTTTNAAEPKTTRRCMTSRRQYSLRSASVPANSVSPGSPGWPGPEGECSVMRL